MILRHWRTMSDEDATPPDDSAAGAPPPPPPPSDGSPTEPLPATEADLPATEAAPAVPPTLPGAEAAPPLIVPLDVPSAPGAAVDEPVGALDPDATAVLATTPDAPIGDEGLPPIPPMAVPLDDDFPPEDDKPWYQRPGPLFGLLLAILAAVGLLIWFFGAGDDDEEEEEVAPTASRLVLETVDETGQDIDRGFIVEVRGPADAANSFEWLEPAGSPPGEAVIGSSGTDGSAVFEWQPDATVTDPAGWGATVSLVEFLSPGWTPPATALQCDRQRLGAPDATVQMDVAVDPADPAVERVATYSFPNYQFLPGDAVTCRLVYIAPVEATTTTSTTPDTTVPETTPTTEPPETTTTTSIDIAPPQPDQTLWDVIDAEDELTEFRDFVEAAGFRDALENADATFTIFAPTNDAIAAAREAGTLPDDEDELRDLLLAHANIEAIIEQQELLLLPSFPVAFGGPQPVTAAPPTIGGAAILFQVSPANNGVLYLISEVLTPVPE
jgi:uncharacterized surface protein with fasciclin (FAS1) repeats